ncbi:YybH family protein [Nocardioides insulae]|uniref:YybH family protein n=1 Tax=Nocardioides insulae TaxID=394734 RepID=UPI0004235AD5|nr:SgcJ/EcaC family oxidoreductase [Nocardioides insulae]
MSNDEQIRELVRRWAEAVHAGDMDTVLADHADDIVMFDVPPPYDGVRGIEAYRATWPGFFQWQASGARFEIVELDVTAGEDVAFAHALLLCGTPEQLTDTPEVRLRLTLGLRREDGRWVVAHEHHSFADPTSTNSDQDVRLVHDAFGEGTRAADLDALMAHIAEEVVSYEQVPPMEYVGVDAVRAVCATGLEAAPHGVDLDTPDLTVRMGGDLAVSWGIDRVRISQEDGSVKEVYNRGTRVFARRDGRWLVVHQHLSLPLESLPPED